MDNKIPVKLIECPRDAMQGWPVLIPTAQKIQYLNKLVQVGFDTLDFGSFVSPKAIPQMADTKEVLAKLDLDKSTTKLLAIIANLRGAEEAVVHAPVHYLGYPFSVSETFQQKNTNSSIKDALDTVTQIQELCQKANKSLVVYLSMGFGNPYGDEWSPNLVFDYVSELLDRGVEIFSLADTVGLATPDQVYQLCSALIKQIPDKEVGVHLHSRPELQDKKLEAAIAAGCNRFDGAMRGIGGCPMAGDELVGNMDTERMVRLLAKHNRESSIDLALLKEASVLAGEIFTHY